MADADLDKLLASLNANNDDDKKGPNPLSQPHKLGDPVPALPFKANDPWLKKLIAAMKYNDDKGNVHYSPDLLALKTLVSSSGFPVDTLNTLMGKQFRSNDSTQTMTALHLCADTCNYEASKLLIAAGANPNIVNADGATAVHLALRTQVNCDDCGKCVEAIAKAAKARIDPHVKNKKGISMIEMTINECEWDAALALVESANFDSAIKTSFGGSILEHAISSNAPRNLLTAIESAKKTPSAMVVPSAKASLAVGSGRSTAPNASAMDPDVLALVHYMAEKMAAQNNDGELRLLLYQVTKKFNL